MLKLYATTLLCLILLTACTDPNSDEAYTKLLQARSVASQADREWRTYLGDKASSQFSPLQQINRDNVHRLHLAWQYDASGGDPELRGETQHNPLIVKGVLYGTSAQAQQMFALNATSGEEIWTWAPRESVSMGQVSRGLVYWQDESAKDERIFFGAGNFVYALDARNGHPVDSFGNGGASGISSIPWLPPRASSTATC
jgi:quinoprotein glucose dehydrogenase